MYIISSYRFFSIILFSIFCTTLVLAQNKTIIKNGGFEEGPRFVAPPWQFDGFDRTTGKKETPIVIDSPSFAHSGRRGLVLGTEDVIDFAGQPIKIPKDGGLYFLELFLSISSVEPVNSVEDIFSVTIKDKSKKRTLKDLMVLSNADEDSFRPFSIMRFDLSLFAGQKVYLELSSSNDILFSTLFIVDDVVVKKLTTEPFILSTTGLFFSSNDQEFSLSGTNFGSVKQVLINGQDKTNLIVERGTDRLKLKGRFLLLGSGIMEDVTIIRNDGQVSNTVRFVATR